jgi:hypothetical protein
MSICVGRVIDLISRREQASVGTQLYSRGRGLVVLAQLGIIATTKLKHVQQRTDSLRLAREQAAHEVLRVGRHLNSVGERQLLGRVLLDFAVRAQQRVAVEWRIGVEEFIPCVRCAVCVCVCVCVCVVLCDRKIKQALRAR